MKQLKNDLKALSKSLNQLRRQTEKMAKRLEKLEKARPAKKPKRKPAVKAKPAKRIAKAPEASAIDQIMALVSKSQKGIDINTLRKRTSISKNNMQASLYRLKKKGLIKSAGRGVYVRS